MQIKSTEFANKDLGARAYEKGRSLILVPMAAVLAPSDALPSGGEPFRLGGRVLFSSASQIVVGDAYGSRNLNFAHALSITPGDLVVLRVKNVDGEFLVEQLEERSPCAEPRGDGEFLRIQNEGRGRLLHARSRIIQTIRDYFQEQEFVEVETPTFVPCPGLDAHVGSLAPVHRGERTDYLITSPEFHMKRLLTAGMPRIVQFARCFRRDEQGPLHEPEFTLIEWYRAFAGFDEVLHDTEEIVTRAAAAAKPERTQPLDLERPFLRFTVREAFAKSGLTEDPLTLAATQSEHYFRLLVETVEPWLASLSRPVFLTDYPVSQAGLARPKPGYPDVSERFELYVRGVELSNGYGELTDAGIQRERFERELGRRELAGEEIYPLDERFLRALQEGLPPCSGNALGLDRLIALVTGAPTIQHTLPFSDQER